MIEKRIIVFKHQMASSADVRHMLAVEMLPALVSVKIGPSSLFETAYLSLAIVSKPGLTQDVQYA